MRTPNHLTSLFAAAASLSLAFSQSSAAPVGAAPVGILTYPVTNSTISSFGVPVLDVVKFSGTSSAIAANVITVSGVTWTASAYSSTPHFVTIRTGAQAGRTLRVTANTTNTLTVDTEDTALNTAGFAVATTDAFELYAGDTIGTLFGSTADGTGTLASGVKGGTSTANADNIYVQSGASMVTYFFNTSLGFWVLDGTTTNQNSLILYPDDGYLIYRNGPTGNLTMVGRAPSSKLLTKLPGGSTNSISVRFPANTTLGGLSFGAPGTWISGTSDADADTISVWVPSGWYWQTFYKSSATSQWLEVGGNGSDQSNVVIPSGTSIQISKKGTATGSASFYSQALPYPL